MKKIACDEIFAADSNFEGRMINGMVNCLALEHGRFNEPLMALGAASASLASDSLNSKLYERATQAWSSFKSDLWFHLELENALGVWWNGLRSGSELDFVGELSREQHEIRELVRQVDADPQKEDQAPVSQARAFVALANLLDRHIERHEAHVFPVIRNAAARRIEEHVSSRESHRADLTVLQGLPRNL